MNEAQKYQEDTFPLRDGSQLELFDDAELFRVVSESTLYCKKSQSTHSFTGDKICKHKKRIYQAIVRLLGEGQSIRYIARLLHVSSNTIYAVACREWVTISKLKKETGMRYMFCARLCIERIIEEIEDIAIEDVKDLKALAIVTGILVNKGRMVLGEAPEQTEHIKGDSLSDAASVIASLPSGPVIEAGIVSGDRPGK